VILIRADSRVPLELLFDEGLGDLFVIRVAGNIVDHAVLGSIEYGWSISTPS
jgi:carbonic anhydrase